MNFGATHMNLLLYSYRNMLVRWKSSLLTASAFALVIGAFVVMVAFVEGVFQACRVSGQPENVMVLGKGISDEILSRIEVLHANQIESTANSAGSVMGASSASREMFMVVSAQDAQTGQYRFQQVRGVMDQALYVHNRVTILHGRMFRLGQSEAIVGRRAARSLNLHLGSPLRIGKREFRVSGIFDAAGAVFESEAWCDLNLLAAQFQRQGEFTTVVLRTPNASTAARVVDRIQERCGSEVTANIETDYYREQAKQVRMLRQGAMLIASLMSAGAVFAVMNTMFAAILARIRDIAVMRLVGISSSQVLGCFLVESVLIACIGGGIGCALGCSINGLTMMTPMGFKDLGFAFHVDAATVIAAFVITLVLGLAGGLLPAVSALRISPLETFRD